MREIQDLIFSNEITKTSYKENITVSDKKHAQYNKFTMSPILELFEDVQHHLNTWHHSYF